MHAFASPSSAPDLFPARSLRPEIRTVAVIGGGIAGLAAATTLQKAGLSVVVLEAEAEVGGRMSTTHRDGMNIDNAAQILSASYNTIPGLLKEVGLQGALSDIGSQYAFVRNGALHTVNLSQPHTFLTSGLLKLREIPAVHGLGAIPALVQSALAQQSGDVTAWTALDDEAALEWSERRFGKAVTQYILNPMLTALYFKDLEAVSKASLLTVLAPALLGKKIQTLAGGIGALCQALSQRLDCRLSCKVTQLSHASGQVSVQTNQGTFTVDAAILAVPANISQGMYPGNTVEERTLLDTRYMPSLTLSVRTAADWTKAHLPAGLCSLMTPRTERDLIYMAFTSTRNVFDVDQGEGMLKFILSGPRIDSLWQASDAEVLEQVAAEAGPYLPGLRSASNFVTSFRYRSGMPNPNRGRFKNIAAYRRSVNASNWVLLAGDYAGHITTDGAAESGVWAAYQLLGC